jgi:hypothetical protein
MKDISFFSNDTYLSIPNSRNPKVILAIGASSLAKNSFKIYNPFSNKAKIFKSVISFFCIYLNSVFKKIVQLEVYENSEFINFLNTHFQKKFTSSIYNATLKDKVVIQLQADNEIYGYLKFPLNETGLKNVKNEILALDKLSENNIVNLKMQSLEFKEIPFFILPELKGTIKDISDDEVLEIVASYKKEVSFKLEVHPRVLEIKAFLLENNLINEVAILENNVEEATDLYFEVYEHGDFAPWNIVKTKDGFSAFDFEYFTEVGLEYFDLIKYHFQVGRLLKGKEEEELYAYVSEKIEIIECKEIISLFLLKEIMIAIEQKKEYSFEEKVLKFING